MGCLGVSRAHLSHTAPKSLTVNWATIFWMEFHASFLEPEARQWPITRPLDIFSEGPRYTYARACLRLLRLDLYFW